MRVWFVLIIIMNKNKFSYVGSQQIETKKWFYALKKPLFTKFQKFFFQIDFQLKKNHFFRFLDFSTGQNDKYGIWLSAVQRQRLRPHKNRQMRPRVLQGLAKSQYYGVLRAQEIFYEPRLQLQARRVQPEDGVGLPIPKRKKIHICYCALQAPLSQARFAYWRD